MGSVYHEAVGHILEGRALDIEQAFALMSAIMEGEISPAQMGFLLGVLRMRGESPEEIAGFAQAMRAKAETVSPQAQNLVDTCGTGGDRIKTFNLSTAAAFVAAGAGISIAKHGNRAITSRCGSADVLEALGANLSISPTQVAEMIDQLGIGFLYAPQHHPALKFAAQPRKEIAQRTFFNLLGPLSNPAGARRQIIGVYAPDLVPLVAQTLQKLGAQKAMVVHGLDGLDEFSPVGQTRAAMLQNNAITEAIFTPEALGVERVTPESIAACESAEQNAALLRESLSPPESPRQSAILLNAAAALWVADAVPSIEEGVSLARQTIQQGRALEKLETFIETSRRYEPTTP